MFAHISTEMNTEIRTGKLAAAWRTIVSNLRTKCATEAKQAINAGTDTDWSSYRGVL
jgi:hypothetical protein